MKILFIGAVRFSASALEKLLKMRADVIGVCTLQQSQMNADHVDLTSIATRAGIPSRYTPDINAPDTLTWIRTLAPDVIFVFGWSRLLKKPLLDIAPLGVIGYHPAELPMNRSRHPLIWALVLGLKETASTFFFMDEEADSGDILSQQRLEISVDDDAGSLYNRMIEVALKQIEEFVPLLENGSNERHPQDHKLANVWRKRGRLDGQIDWRMPAHGIYNLVRGLTRPYVGAHFVYEGTDIKVWRCSPEPYERSNIEPGKLIAVDDAGVLVKAGIDAVRLLEIEPELRLRPGDYL